MAAVDGPVPGFVGGVPAFPAGERCGTFEGFPSLTSWVGEGFVGVDAHGGEVEVDGFAGEVAGVVNESPLFRVPAVADA